MANEKRSIDVRRIIKAITSVLTAEIPGTSRNRQAPAAQPRQAAQAESNPAQGRVMYVALSGSVKAKNGLSTRAQEVLAAINRQRKATSAALQSALNVNRNVIAGAIHELKQAKFVKALSFEGPAYESAAEFRPRSVRRSTHGLRPAVSNDRPARRRNARRKTSRR